jgi:GNAT superfamily N-acetyltransferase
VVELRPMRVPDDCAGVARVRSACLPAWPVSAEEVESGEARRLPDRLHWPCVAVDGGGIAGYGYVEELGVAARPGRLRIRVLVDPQQRRRGLGRRLYDRLQARATAAGADELVTEVRADDAAAVRFVDRLGFTRYHARLESRLRLDEVDPASVARGIDAHADAWFARGVRVATYRQLQWSADAARRLYDLDAALWADVPFGLAGTVPGFEQYLALELADPGFLPPATFVALDGDRWIGLAALMEGPECLLNSMTGVARDWRRRGLARWLKLHTIRWALEREAHEIRSFNDAGNAAMLALNASLGFRVVATELRYRRELR